MFLALLQVMNSESQVDPQKNPAILEQLGSQKT